MKYNNHFNIPINICIFAVKNQAYSQIRLYIYLKANYPNGIYYRNKNFIKKYCNEIGINERSYLNHFNWLLKNKLIYRIGINVYIINSFGNILMLIPHYSYLGAIFELDFNSFKSFIIAAVVTYFGRKKNWSDFQKFKGKEKDGKVILIKWRDFSGFTSPSSFTLPIKYLAKILGISKSSAQKIRNCTSEFIESEHRFAQVIINDNRTININQLQQYKKFYSDNPEKIRVQNNLIMEQQNDILSSKIILCKISKKIRKNRYRYKVVNRIEKKNPSILSENIELVNNINNLKKYQNATI